VKKENNALAFIFVAVQFLSLYLIASTGPLFPASPILIFIELAGLTLGIWAILAMGIGNFNISPEIKEGSLFVQRGPYKVIRHPMYTSLLLITLPLVIALPSPQRWIYWLVLLIDLVLKLTHEEKLLIATHPQYASYRRVTARLIPFLF
jgi:protein-S-isoprenylcysteine O-methyltransferase Ste14